MVDHLESCISLALKNKAYGEMPNTIYINCDDSKGTSCRSQQNNLFISISVLGDTECSNHDFTYISTALSLSGVLLLNTETISITQPEGYQVNVDTSGGKAMPVINITPNKFLTKAPLIPITPNSLELNLKNIDYYYIKNFEVSYTLTSNFECNNNKYSISNSATLHLIKFPSSEQKYWYEFIDVGFSPLTSSQEGRKEDSIVYNSGPEGYNQDIPNKLAFYFGNGRNKVINFTTESYFTVTFISSINPHIYNALGSSSNVNCIGLSSDQQASFMKFDETNLKKNDKGNGWIIFFTDPINMDPYDSAIFFLDNIIANYQEGITYMHINAVGILCDNRATNSGIISLPKLCCMNRNCNHYYKDFMQQSSCKQPMEQ